MNALSLLLLSMSPAADPVSIPATRDEMKKMLEESKKSVARLPFPEYPDGRPPINNAAMRAHLPVELRDAGFQRDPDPNITLDGTYKVLLFWITSRANNCVYCLGHQEHKLTAAGLTDDQIAALDGDWSEFKDAEKAGMKLTKKLTFEPHTFGPDSLDEALKYYKPREVLEMVMTVGQYNSVNRWTGSLRIPAEENANFFAKGKTGIDLSTFLHPTSAKYKGVISSVAPLENRKTGPAMVIARPDREPRDVVEAKLKSLAGRKALLPLADEKTTADLLGAGPHANWERLLANFPKYGKNRAASLKLTREKGNIVAKTRALIDWAAAREDRAWYMLADSKKRLNDAGLSDDAIYAAETGSGITEPEAAAMAFTRKLTAQPASITDGDFERLRKHYSIPETAEIVHRVCTAAFMNRLTEAAQLPR